MVKYYLLSILLCLLPPIYYPFFRQAVKSHLIRTSINQKRFKSLMKGSRNFWRYEAVHAEFPLGMIYHVNKLAFILYPSVLFLVLILGWLRFAAPFISAFYGCICILTAGMTLFSSFEINISTYGKPFVLLKKTPYNRYTSSVLDLTAAAFPLLAGYVHIHMTLKVFSII